MALERGRRQLETTIPRVRISFRLGHSKHLVYDVYRPDRRFTGGNWKVPTLLRPFEYQSWRLRLSATLRDLTLTFAYRPPNRWKHSTKFPVSMKALCPWEASDLLVAPLCIVWYSSTNNTGTVSEKRIANHTGLYILLVLSSLLIVPLFPFQYSTDSCRWYPYYHQYIYLL
jgi:hypothetical protein